MAMMMGWTRTHHVTMMMGRTRTHHMTMMMGRPRIHHMAMMMGRTRTSRARDICHQLSRAPREKVSKTPTLPCTSQTIF